MTRWFVTVGLIGVVAACGRTEGRAPGDADAPPGQSETSSSLAGADPTSGAGPSEPAAGADSGPPSSSSGAAPTSGGAAAGPSTSNPPGSFPFAMSLSTSCVTPAGRLTTLFVTRARASIAAAVSYSDSSSHGAQLVAEAGPDGRYVWDVVVAPTAPLGRAEVLASVQDRTPSPDGGAFTTGEGAQGSQSLDVRASC